MHHDAIHGSRTDTTLERHPSGAPRRRRVARPAASSGIHGRLAPVPQRSEGRRSSSGEAFVIAALRAGDEGTFQALVAKLHGPLLRTALNYVRDHDAAEDVVQETWVGFLRSMDRFEGRCSVKTWLFRILFNKAKTRAAQDQRFIPFSSLVSRECGTSWNGPDPASGSQDGGVGDGQRCAARSTPWHTNPERVLLDKEALGAVRDAIAKLPPAQGTVMLLRDVEGLSSAEVCNALDLTATNQRVLLHRARTKVRSALAGHYDGAV